jgi:hypothetical protein
MQHALPPANPQKGGKEPGTGREGRSAVGAGASAVVEACELQRPRPCGALLSRKLLGRFLEGPWKVLDRQRVSGRRGAAGRGWAGHARGEQEGGFRRPTWGKMCARQDGCGSGV